MEIHVARLEYVGRLTSPLASDWQGSDSARHKLH